MQPLHTRLDHQKDRVLKVTELFGRSRAMEEFEVSDYVCFSEWLKEVTRDENFGLRPKIHLDGGQTFTNQLAVKVIRMLLDLQAENERLVKENRELKRQLLPDGRVDADQALAILEVCQA